MTNLARMAEVARLLEALEPLEDQLLANELEMVRSLRTKYAEPGVTDFDDAVVLEVVLRNVEIRRGYLIDAKTESPRLYELERRSDGEPDNG